MVKGTGILYLKWIPAHLLVEAKYISYPQISRLRKLNRIDAKYLGSTLMIDIESLENSLTENPEKLNY